ncbi:MAG: hypothetical protein SFX73_08425 [Kofleriaceae bacterium]|nr:hypothetical protein [Kofleriaceae bacterium]
MRDVERLAAEIEPVVDQHGIAEVLEALSFLCQAKSDHIEAAWQDRPLARAWKRVGDKVAQASRAARTERL